MPYPDVLAERNIAVLKAGYAFSSGMLCFPFNRHMNAVFKQSQNSELNWIEYLNAFVYFKICFSLLVYYNIQSESMQEGRGLPEARKEREKERERDYSLPSLDQYESNCARKEFREFIFTLPCLQAHTPPHSDHTMPPLPLFLFLTHSFIPIHPI